MTPARAVTAEHAERRGDIMARLRPAIVLIAVATLLLCAGAASAQADFASLNMKVGEVIYVTDESGMEVKGRITSLSPQSIAIGTRAWAPSADLKIEREGDPVWDGAAIGAAIGLVQMLRGGAQGAPNAASVPWFIAAATAETAAIGALIDWAHKGRTVIYPKLPGSPR